MSSNATAEPVSAATAAEVTNKKIAAPYTPTGKPSTTSFVKHNGANFKTVEYEHSGEYKGTIIFVHGFAEQSDLYIEFFDKLAQKGFDIFFFDQRGAGETSPGKEYGKTDEKFQMGDLDFFIDYNSKKAGKENEKFFLMGHSMGGAIILNYGIIGKHKDKIRGIVSNGPMIASHPNTAPSAVVMFLSPVINKLVPNLKVDSKLDINYITSNKKWQDYIKAHDAKLIGTIRLFNDMFARGDLLKKPAHVKNWSPSIPLLLIHGNDDSINDYKYSKKFYEYLPKGIDKEYYEIEGGRHSTFIESDEITEKVLDKVVSFLESHN